MTVESISLMPNQMVIAQNQRLERAPSFATEVLEEHYQVLAKWALKRGRRGDEYLIRLSALRAIRARPVARE